jgi:hypothetical protein
MQDYDRSSKWLIKHHGDSILRIAGVRNIATWKALQAELVQPRRLPDGLIEVRGHGQDTPDYYILEIATYPEARIAQQVVDDMALVYLDRHVLPEVVVLFLHPKGNVEATSAVTHRSRQGWTDWRVSWRIVKLWEVPASDLLAAGDVGLIPWVPLTRFEDSPESIFRECRARIDHNAPPDEHENLLAVTQVLAGLRYDDPGLFQLLGGRKAMIESPVLQRLLQETRQETRQETKQQDIRRLLVVRFGIAAPDIEAELSSIDDEARLDQLFDLAATSSDLDSFRKQLSP